MLRAAHAVMALLFFTGAWLQRNDPDPLRWMMIFGLAGIASVRVAAGRSSWFLAGGVGAVALGWAVVLVPRVRAESDSLRSITDWSDRTAFASTARELAGLLLVSAWMATIVVTQRPRRRPSSSPS